MERLRKGMDVRVRISDNLRSTNNQFTAVPEMHDLKGKIIKIYNISHNGTIDAGQPNKKRWNWHADDLEPIDNNPDGIIFSPKKSKVETFDPQKLMD